MAINKQYTTSYFKLDTLEKAALHFDTVDEAWDHFEPIRQKLHSVEIWSYPYIKECEGIVEFGDRNGMICETTLIQEIKEEELN